MISVETVGKAKIVFRPMLESDLDAALLIEEASYTAPWRRAMFLSELRNNPYSTLWVALDENERLIGYVCFWVVFDELYLMNLSVHQDYRRKGIGEELIRRVLRYGRERGVREATLEVRASNRPAIRLYEKIGFEVVAIRPKYYQEPREDGIVMVQKA